MIFKELNSAKAKDFFGFQKDNFIDFWNENQVRSSFDNPNFHCIACLIEEKIVCAVCYTEVLDECEIELVLTDRRFRRKGYGDSALKNVTESLKKQGIKSVFLEVRKGNESAKGLYLKNGFAVYGERKKYYKDGEDAVLMRLSL